MVWRAGASFMHGNQHESRYTRGEVVFTSVMAGVTEPSLVKAINNSFDTFEVVYVPRYMIYDVLNRKRVGSESLIDRVERFAHEHGFTVEHIRTTAGGAYLAYGFSRAGKRTEPLQWDRPSSLL
jgi:hypothetical protein